MILTEIITWTLNFLNGNQGFVTLLVGGSAIYLYLKQKADQKRDAASLILQEIRYAEQQIRIARDRESNFPLADKLLPTNSWHNNINLFIKDLKETEIDLISRFYSHANYLDIVIGIISSQKNNMLAPVNKQTPGVVQSAPTPAVIQEFELNATKILKEVSKKIEFIYNTPAIDRLRSISERKWYQIF